MNTTTRLKPGPKGDKPAHLRTEIHSISMPAHKWAALDKARGHASRSRYLASLITVENTIQKP